MNEVSISAVIPTYNRAALLMRAIKSILSQTRPVDEILVIDDGSIDDTLDVCNRFGATVKYIHQANAGPAVARNLGISKAKSKWIAFLDSDDTWTPRHIEHIVSAIEETKGGAGVYFANLKNPAGSARDTLWGSAAFIVPGNILLQDDGSDWVLMKRQPLMLQASVFNRALLSENGGLNPEYRFALEDTELFCRMGIGAAMCAVNHVGTIQTADDVSTNRLTEIYSTKSQVFVTQSIILWRSVLNNQRLKERRYRSMVREKLANAFWRQARLSWSLANWAKSACYICRSTLTSPRFLGNVFLSKIQKWHLKRDNFVA